MLDLPSLLQQLWVWLHRFSMKTIGLLTNAVNRCLSASQGRCISFVFFLLLPARSKNPIGCWFYEFWFQSKFSTCSPPNSKQHGNPGQARAGRKVGFFLESIELVLKWNIQNSLSQRYTSCSWTLCLCCCCCCWFWSFKITCPYWLCAFFIQTEVGNLIPWFDRLPLPQLQPNLKQLGSNDTTTFCCGICLPFGLIPFEFETAPAERKKMKVFFQPFPTDSSSQKMSSKRCMPLFRCVDPGTHGLQTWDPMGQVASQTYSTTIVI